MKLSNLKKNARKAFFILGQRSKDACPACPKPQPIGSIAEQILTDNTAPVAADAPSLLHTNRAELDPG